MGSEVWKTIPGWFDFADICDRAVEEAADGAKFLEIGCWLGRSTRYLGERILESGKDIRLFVVDTFEGVPNDPAQQQLTNLGISVYDQFLANLRLAEIEGIVTVYKGSSLTAHSHFEDHNLDMVFYGDHSYEAVRKDILLSASKVKSGGDLAWHDYRDAEGIRRAVDEILGNCPASELSWATRVNK